jgi:mono/diheme cytochrome c family protein
MISMVRITHRGNKILGLIVFLTLVITQPAFVTPSAQSTMEGMDSFDSPCSGFHTSIGEDQGRSDLLYVPKKCDQQMLENFISNLSKLIANSDSTNLVHINNYSNFITTSLNLSWEQVTAVIRYLEEQPATSDYSMSQSGLSQGNPDNGRDIFIGNVKMVNGGPACITCHSIDDVGILGGGAMGPNLTQAAVKYGDVGLASALANITFPTMQPLFEDHTLTVSEQADLVAYIKSQAGQQQINKEFLILAISLAGFLVVIALAAFYWRGRLRSVRQQLVDEAQARQRNP